MEDVARFCRLRSLSPGCQGECDVWIGVELLPQVEEFMYCIFHSPFMRVEKVFRGPSYLTKIVFNFTLL